MHDSRLNCSIAPSCVPPSVCPPYSAAAYTHAQPAILSEPPPQINCCRKALVTLQQCTPSMPLTLSDRPLLYAWLLPPLLKPTAMHEVPPLATCPHLPHSSTRAVTCTHTHLWRYLRFAAVHHTQLPPSCPHRSGALLQHILSIHSVHHAPPTGQAMSQHSQHPPSHPPQLWCYWVTTIANTSWSTRVLRAGQ
jgi:hypothetical protein